MTRGLPVTRALPSTRGLPSTRALDPRARGRIVAAVSARAILVTSAIGAVGVLATLAACGRAPSPSGTGHGVLVVVIDALRADHMSCSGYDRPTTPMLDEIAARGVRFTNVFSTSPELLPSHASLLTGCDPTLARRPSLGDVEQPLLARWYIPDRVPRLAQEFLAHGYTTAAFVDHPAISPVFGFGAGFQSFLGFDPEDKPTRDQMGYRAVQSKFFDWLAARSASEDWFAYFHLHDLDRLWIPDDAQPLDPRWDTYFEPREELSAVPPVGEADELFFAIPRSRWDGATKSVGEYEARYDGALCFLDTQMRYLMESLRRRGWALNTTIVVVGSYGFGLGESGLYLDSGTLSDVDLHVPLIFRPAPSLGCETNAKSTILASTIDVAPTLLDLAGIARPKGMHGRSLAGALRGDAASVREYAYASGGLQAGHVVFDERWCFERSRPGASRPDVVALSWYGDDDGASRVERTFLHDRSSARSFGHVVAPVEDAAVAARLDAAGTEWFRWVDKAREVLQGSIAGDTTELREELRRRGLIE